jgi:hypothetical protein
METIAKLEGRLASWLESEKFKENARDMRHKILNEIKSPEHMKNMSYSDKVDFLNYFFSGWDDDGRKYGIYVQRNEQMDFWEFLKRKFSEDGSFPNQGMRKPTKTVR